MKTALSIMLAFALIAASATSAQQIWTQGKLDCAGWVEGRAQGNAVPIEHYTQGLLNGLAMGRGVEIWKGQGQQISPKQAFLWMDKYCRDNPLSHVMTGAYALANEKTAGGFNRVYCAPR